MDEQHQKSQPPRPGDLCAHDGCSGRIAVYSTRVNVLGRVRIRYLSCDACGAKPVNNKWIVPLEFAPVRATSST